MIQHGSDLRAPHTMLARRLVLGFAAILVGSSACEVDDGSDDPFMTTSEVEESSGNATSEDTGVAGSGTTGDTGEGDASDTGEGDTDDGGSNDPHGPTDEKAA